MEKTFPKKGRKVISVKKIKHNKAKIFFLTSLALTICLSTTGCSYGDITLDSPIYFDGENFEDAQAIQYYYIRDNGKEYFVEKLKLANAIPNTDYLYDVGLKVDEYGNTVVVPPLEIKNTPGVEVILTSCKKYFENNEVKVIMGGVDKVQLVKGYKIITDGQTYDIRKIDVVNLHNDNNNITFNNKLGLIYEHNPDGGPDYVYTK